MNILLQRDFTAGDGTVELIYTQDAGYYISPPFDDWIFDIFNEVNDNVLFRFYNSVVGTEIDGYTLIAKWED